MKRRLDILLSNDDGFRAAGLVSLAAELRPMASITVVAPDRNRSGASNSLTLDSPLRVREEDQGVYSAEACTGSIDVSDS